MRKTWLSLLGALVAGACSPVSPDAESAGGAEIPEGATDTPPPETPGGGTSSGGEAPSPIAKGVALTATSFRNIGRLGEDLRVAVKGTDAAKNTSAIFVRFVDAAGAPVVALDTDWDGVPDASERRFHFDVSTIGQASFTGSVVIPGTFSPTSKIAKAVVALENEAGGRTAPMEQEIALQALRGEGQACDPARYFDRCPAGMGCGGTPSSCQAGVAPSFVRVGYFGGASPRMVFQGTEPDEDIDEIAIEFLDASGSGQTVNVGSEENPDMSAGISIDARGSNSIDAFSVTSRPIQGFDLLVPKIAATVRDTHGHTSSRLVVAASPMPVRGVGQACDHAGFDTCSTGNVCSPGLAESKNKCASATPLRATKCKDGPALDPAKGKTQAFGTTSGASLWDAPIGCIPNDAKELPESAVRLHLATAATTLIVSTALPETDFDTAVYLLPGCAPDSSTALGCNDDVKGYSSTLTLANVPAGDYTIVIDSVRPRGGHFGVSVEVK